MTTGRHTSRGVGGLERHIGQEGRLDAGRVQKKKEAGWTLDASILAQVATGLRLAALPPVGEEFFPTHPDPTGESPVCWMSPGDNLAEARDPRMSPGAERPDVHVVDRPFTS